MTHGVHGNSGGTADCGVHSNETFLDGLFKSHTAACMASSHHTVGESFALLILVLKPTGDLQTCVEVLQVILSQLV